MRPSPRTLFGALCFCVLSASPCLLEAETPTDTLQASRAGETWILAAAGDTARIETPGGQAVRFALPPQAEINSLAALDDGWILAGSVPQPGGQRRLFLLAGGAEGAPRALAEPPGQVGRERRFPVLLADGGRLAGLAWLEGDDAQSLAVRAAVWTGRRFRAPEPVSTPGPGSQMALTGAVLADGSWLLAWSAFDGEDDEIVWSRRLGGQWLPVRPASAANAVPDITPALTATAGGALLAWSRYDGESYSLRLARFDGDGWSGERAAGPAGSLYPAWSGEPDRLRLLYFTALPRGWVALETDASGKSVRRAGVTAPFPERPAVTEGAAAELRLRWPARQREAAAAWEAVP